MSVIPPSLDDLEDPFRGKALLLQERLERDGLPMRLFEARRTFTRQRDLYAVGRQRDSKGVWRVVGATSTKALPGQSAHNWGFAVDFVLDPLHSWWGSQRPSGPWDTGSPTRPLPGLAWEKYGRLVRECGLVWGGDWGWDKPHAELKEWRNLRPKNWLLHANAEAAAGR